MAMISNGLTRQERTIQWYYFATKLSSQKVRKKKNLAYEYKNGDI